LKKACCWGAVMGWGSWGSRGAEAPGWLGAKPAARATEAASAAFDIGAGPLTAPAEGRPKSYVAPVA